MVTGDAMLTAAEVVRQVGIIDALQERTYELCHLVENSKQEQFVFLPLDHGEEVCQCGCTVCVYTIEIFRAGSVGFEWKGKLLREWRCFDQGAHARSWWCFFLIKPVSIILR